MLRLKFEASAFHLPGKFTWEKVDQWTRRHLVLVHFNLLLLSFIIIVVLFHSRAAWKVGCQ